MSWGDDGDQKRFVVKWAAGQGIYVHIADTTRPGKSVISFGSNDRMARAVCKALNDANLSVMGAEQDERGIDAGLYYLAQKFAQQVKEDA